MPNLSALTLVTTTTNPVAPPPNDPLAARLMAEAHRLPTLPAVVPELMASLNSDDSPLTHIAGLVRQDPVLSARVLRAGRTVARGPSMPAMSVDQAIMRVGFSELRALLIAGAVADTLFEVSDVDFDRFWTHSAGTARLVQKLAPLVDVPRDVGYTAGIVHAIGWLMLVRAFPLRELELAELHGRGRIARQVVEERRITGTDHAFAGALLARRWSFPTLLVDAVADYVDPAARERNALARAVWIASTLVGAARSEDSLEVEPDASQEIDDTLQVARDELLAMTAAAIDRATLDVGVLRR
jgi:HD-like signal output (HDOD) protein